MKTSTLLIAAAGVAVLGLVVVMSRRQTASFTTPAPVTASPVVPRPKSGRDFASMFDPTSSTSAFGGQVKDLITGGLGSLFGP